MENENSLVVESKPLPVPQSRADRLLYAFIVMVLPPICFALSGALMPEWQSGKLSDYFVMLLVPQTTWFFFPFLVYSIMCMLLLLAAPRRFATWLPIRLGIYLGVVLALHYVILDAGTDFVWLSAISAGVLIVLRWIFLRKEWSAFWMGVILVLALVGLVISTATGSSLQIIYLVLIGGLAAAPYLCLTVAGVTALKLLRHYEAVSAGTIWLVAGALAWLAAYFVAWRFSIVQAVQAYHALPVAPPDCYVATASARGHLRVVRSWPVQTPGGVRMVTRQLQTLKCAELALRVLTPGLHQMIRAVYDLAGPPLARQLANPFLADLAYLSLKPFEWGAVLILKPILPDLDELAGQLYGAS